ncbi:hypothetical protein HDU88_008420 [Geranomyces variabilis]|nr:hypothetical protein HDU88_008420 [Geranomyces variabilis]
MNVFEACTPPRTPSQVSAISDDEPTSCARKRSATEGGVASKRAKVIASLASSAFLSNLFVTTTATWLESLGVEHDGEMIAKVFLCFKVANFTGMTVGDLKISYNRFWPASVEDDTLESRIHDICRRLSNGCDVFATSECFCSPTPVSARSPHALCIEEDRFLAWRCSGQLDSLWEAMLEARLAESDRKHSDKQKEDAVRIKDLQDRLARSEGRHMTEFESHQEELGEAFGRIDMLSKELDQIREQPTGIFDEITENIISADLATSEGRQRIKEWHDHGVALLQSFRKICEGWNERLNAAEEADEQCRQLELQRAAAARQLELQRVAEHNDFLSRFVLLQPFLTLLARSDERLELPADSLRGGTYEGLDLSKSTKSQQDCVDMLQKSTKTTVIMRLVEVINLVGLFRRQLTAQESPNLMEQGWAKAEQKRLRNMFSPRRSFDPAKRIAHMYYALTKAFGMSSVLLIARHRSLLNSISKEGGFDRERDLLAEVGPTWFRLRDPSVPERKYGYYVHEPIFEALVASVEESKPDLKEDAFARLERLVQEENSNGGERAERN